MNFLVQLINKTGNRPVYQVCLFDFETPNIYSVIAEIDKELIAEEHQKYGSAADWAKKICNALIGDNVTFTVSNDGGKTGIFWRDNVIECLDYLEPHKDALKDYYVVAVRKRK